MAEHELRGREREIAVLQGLVDAARTGRSDVLVLRGEAGVGKSALLDALAAKATGCQVIRADGIESEMELAYSGLHQVCQPFLDRIGRLPEPQYAALGTAFGLLSGPPPAKFLIGLAVLNLLADAAVERPVVCVVDDAQWIDLMSARVLAFVARRLEAESVVMVVSVREGTEHAFDGLPELEVRGLGEDDARALLGSVLPGPLDPRVRDRIVAETRGNPLALIELPHAWTVAELADGLGAGPLTRRIEDSFVRRLDVLPADTRLLLLAAAAEPLGDATLLWRAAERLGLGDGPAAGALESGLIAIGQHVRFRHPLVRSTVYRMASPQDRQLVHRVLAEVTDAQSEPDRRAWHRAQATALPDEEVAAELEQSAQRAQSRGGFFAAAALLERAVELTPEPGPRARRAVAAAIAKWRSGALDSALALLGGAAAGPLDAAAAAAVDWLRGEIAFDQGRTLEAARMLLDAAGRLDGDRAQDAYLEAISAAIWASGPDTRAVVAAAAVQVVASDRPADLLLQALAQRVTRGYAAAAPQLVTALAQARDAEIGGRLWLAGGMVALELADLESGLAMAARQDAIARRTGALVQLQSALDFRAGLTCLTGDLAAAGRMVDEDRQIAELTGSRRGSAGRMVLEAYRGNERPARELIAELQTGGGRLAAFATYASALLHNGFGRYDVARDAALEVFEQDIVGYGVLVAGELVEAASRTGDTKLVETALSWLNERAATDWGHGLAARASALLNADEDAYLQSLDYLERTPVRVEVARGRLLYGEWLRREGRRVDAREQLRTAHDLLTEMGLQAFADRARHELLATGETVRKRTPETRTDLTAQESQIAALARDGLTNPEIAAQLFISPRTVEWHLRKTFAKLGITSRRQLRTAFQ
ncbi:AAA family ATPase [Kribbella sp. NPDC056345]|uniref:ATP-binding protein n=1 Tax=Kribbella sp. NPDC056345 TaxID=3345789 RepID=UPI0035E32DAC